MRINRISAAPSTVFEGLLLPARPGLTGARADSVAPVHVDDTVTGSSGNDNLTGTKFDDTLDGGLGADTMTGGAGNDTYVVDNVGDLVVERATGGTGDTVLSSINYALGSTVENLVLTGLADLNGKGNNTANHITGNAGNNRLDGGGGADTLEGGAGNDTYVLDSLADAVVEQADSGHDLVMSTVSVILSANVEDLELLGNLRGYGIGNALNNRITGSANANQLQGGGGVDTLDGAAGNDLLTLHAGVAIGGTGQDSVSLDQIDEAAWGYSYWQVGGPTGSTTLYSNSSRSDIATALAGATSLDLIAGGGPVQLSMSGVESWSVATGSSGNDLVLSNGTGTEFQGGAGTDTFYADWSARTDGLSILRDSAEAGAIHVNGFERLLIATGKANDRLDLGAGSGDEVSTGAGNDTVSAGTASIELGAGSDQASLAWGSVDGGAGADSVTLTSVYDPYGSGTYWVLNGTSVNLNASRATIESALSSGSSFSLFNAYNGAQQLTLNNVETLSVLAGGDGSSLIFALGANQTYAGGGGTDTFYANWGSATRAITWVNDPAAVQTVNGNTVSGFERLILSTGAGNDLIDNSANSTSDDFITGAGNDTVTAGTASIDLGSGNDRATLYWGSVDGGAGTDSVTLTSVYDPYANGSYWVLNGTNVNLNSSRATIESALSSGSSFSLFNGYNGAQQLSLNNVENLSVLAGGEGSSLVFALGAHQTYAGGGGTDTFYANWSSATKAITWVNDPAATQVVNGTTVSGFERLILSTGAGNDRIDNSANSTSDDFITGAGNDTVTAGTASIDLGSGNDRATLYWGSVDGGAGTDSVTLTGLYDPYANGTYWVLNGTSVNVNSSRATIESALGSGSQFSLFNAYNGAQQLSLNGVENLSILAGSEGHSLVFALGANQTYAGAGGTDSFYANWSAASSDIVWVNDAAATQVINGNTLSGFERLILSTGSGNDSIDNSAFNFGDDLITGAGNDTVIVTTATLALGEGDDKASLGWGTVDGGAGSDSVTLTSVYDPFNYSTYWVLNGTAVNINSSRATIESALGSGSSYSLYNAYNGAQQLNLNGVESLSVLGGADGNSLMFALGANQTYAGGGGADSFYANWSAASSDIVWVNDGVTTQVINGNTLSGFERLILTTGSGNDSIDNSAFNIGDDLITGAGNDTVIVNTATLVLGEGDDKASLGWGTVDGGAGSDSVTLTSVYDPYGYSTYWVLNATSVNVSSSRATIESALGSGSSYSLYNAYNGYQQLSLNGVESLSVLGGGDGNSLMFALGANQTYVGGGGTDSFYANWSSASGNIEWVNDAAVTQVVNGNTLSGFERLILTTGSGDDSIDNSAYNSGDDLITGAGNDTVIVNTATLALGEGDDSATLAWGTVDGGAGNDSVTLTSLYDPYGYGTYWVANGVGLNVNSDRSSIESALNGGSSFSVFSYYNGYQQLSLSGVENLGIAAGGDGSALVFALGDGGHYAGGGGTDTFYANWSATSADISWVNTGAEQTVNGALVSGLERLILTTGSGNDLIDNSANSTADDLEGGAGSDTLTGGAGGDLFRLGSLVGSDTITDFSSGSDLLQIRQSTLAVGNGNSTVDAATTVVGTSGFASGSELVVFADAVTGSLDATQAAQHIGSASSNFASGQTAVFVLHNDTDSAVYYFQSSGDDAQVSADELSLLAVLQGNPLVGTGDLVFGG